MSNQNSSIQQSSSSAMDAPGVGLSQILETNTPSTSSSHFGNALDKKDAEMLTSVRDYNTKHLFYLSN